MNMTDTKSTEFLEQPYTSRQLIVVSEDVVVEAAEQQNQKIVEVQQDRIDWARIAESIIMETIPLGNVVADLTRESIKAWGRAKNSGLMVLPVGLSTASTLSFPPGHPREGVLYIGHPALPNVYYTLADFHRVTFEHKFCEATNLLMSLGATSIRVEHVRGWSRDFSSRISVPLGEVENTAQVGASSSAQAQLLFEANLSGSVEPSVPDKLVWYEHEPTWQTIANGRIKYGLRDFSLTVTYEDDFGVNAGLKSLVGKSGLEVGGKFEDHESTIWRLEGKFKDLTSTNA